MTMPILPPFSTPVNRVPGRICADPIDPARADERGSARQPYPSSSSPGRATKQRHRDNRALERPCAYGNDEDLFTGTRTRTAQEKSARTTKSIMAQVMIAMGRPGSPPAHSLRIRILLGTRPYLDACSVIRRGDDSRIRRIAVDGTQALSRATGTVSKRYYLHLEHVHLQVVEDQWNEHNGPYHDWVDVFCPSISSESS